MKTRMKLSDAFLMVNDAFRGRDIRYLIRAGSTETSFTAIASDGENLITIGVRNGSAHVNDGFEECLARATAPVDA